MGFGPWGVEFSCAWGLVFTGDSLRKRGLAFDFHPESLEEDHTVPSRNALNPKPLVAAFSSDSGTESKSLGWCMVSPGWV